MKIMNQQEIENFMNEIQEQKDPFIRNERKLRLYNYLRNKPFRDFNLAVERFKIAIVDSFKK